MLAFAIPAGSLQGQSTSVDPAGLSYSTTYEWLVRAFSTNPYEPALSDGGTWFLVTTVVAPPETFNKISPVTALNDQTSRSVDQLESKRQSLRL